METDIRKTETSVLTPIDTNAEGVAENMPAAQLDSDRFSVWSTIGVHFSAAASPLAVGGYLGLIQGVGGSPFFFWGFIFATTGQFLVCLSMAEIASVFPHTAGQVYWTAVLAPRKIARGLTYVVGIASILAWLFALAASAVYCGLFVLAAAEISSNYTELAWHLFLVAILVNVVGGSINSYGIRFMPWATKFNVCFLNASTLFVFITLLAKAHPKASAKTVFLDVVNDSGWQSTGWVFFISLLPGCFTTGLFDAATHITDELPNPAKQVPQVMIWTTVLCASTTFLMIIAMTFSTVNPSNLLDPLGDQPILQLCYDAWPNMGYVLTVCAIYIIFNVFGVAACCIETSRLFWSFAQMGGLTGNKWLSRTDSRRQVPLNSVLTATVASSICCVLVFAPAAVENAILGSSGLFFIFAYAPPILLFLLRGRRRLPSRRYINLGRFGPVINTAALCWMSLESVVLCFPQFYPVTTDNMNWTSVVGIAALAVSSLNWILIRKTFKLPENFADKDDQWDPQMTNQF